MSLGKGNHLLYGDNATVMRTMMDSRSVDLIYLDPPFKSDKNYNLIYSTMTGKPVPEQAEAFCDTWTLNTTKADLLERLPKMMREAGVDATYLNFWTTWVSALQGSQSSLLAYLYYMVERLLWMKPILKDTGSIVLHCDPTASHYIKVMMDGIFGHQNFRNEIIWKRTSSHNDAKRFAPVHDCLLYYSKGKTFSWNPQYVPHSEKYIKSHYSRVDKAGRQYRLDNIIRSASMGPRPNLAYEYRGITPEWGWRVNPTKLKALDNAGRIAWIDGRDGKPTAYLIRYLDEQTGAAMPDVWDDISPVNSQAKDRLGYPTQKPKPLLTRIIKATSDDGATIFDPFCGCGTTIYAAQEIGQRRWIGCDIAILAVKLIREILTERYRLAEGTDFSVTGIPNSAESAKELFDRDPFQFEHWAVERVGGFPTRRTGDRGIDGKVYYETSSGLRSMVLSVKGGHVKPEFIRELSGVVNDEPDADLGGFICLHPPTAKMREAARDAGDFVYRGIAYPRVQILTVEQIIEGKIEFKSPTKVGSKLSTGQGAIAFD